jgi:hypothetical protein
MLEKVKPTLTHPEPSSYRTKEVTLLAKRFDTRSLKHLIDTCELESEEPELEWKQVQVDEDFDDGSEEIVETEVVATLPPKRRRPIPHRVPPPGFRYPVWEKRVRLIGETRLDAGENDIHRSSRIVPLDVFFSSPPTLDRQVIVCGFVLAKIIWRRLTKQVALPFQATFPAWPVRDQDRVVEDLLNFAGNRVCPTLITTPNGRIRKAIELKVAFDANIKVFHQPRCPAPRC